MTWNEYQEYFSSILKNENPPHPYDDAAYFQYAKLNMSRQNRWLKTGELSAETKQLISGINTAQQWIVITEPWCGDAAHSLPFIYLLSELNPKIVLSIQLRDSDSEIDKYLTGTSKSIPILIVRNKEGEDIFHWGPRPSGCSKLYTKLKAAGADLEALKIELQNWYNADKGNEIQNEILFMATKDITDL